MSHTDVPSLLSLAVIPPLRWLAGYYCNCPTCDWLTVLCPPSVIGCKDASAGGPETNLEGDALHLPGHRHRGLHPPGRTGQMLSRVQCNLFFVQKFGRLGRIWMQNCESVYVEEASVLWAIPTKSTLRFPKKLLHKGYSEKFQFYRHNFVGDGLLFGLSSI